MSLVINNLPKCMFYRDIKNLVRERCGVNNVTLENLRESTNGKQVTVLVKDDGDAAILMRTFNGMYLMGNQLFVERDSTQNINITIPNVPAPVPPTWSNNKPAFNAMDAYNPQTALSKQQDDKLNHNRNRKRPGSNILPFNSSGGPVTNLQHGFGEPSNSRIKHEETPNLSYNDYSQGSKTAPSQKRKKSNNNKIINLSNDMSGTQSQYSSNEMNNQMADYMNKLSQLFPPNMDAATKQSLFQQLSGFNPVAGNPYNNANLAMNQTNYDMGLMNQNMSEQMKFPSLNLAGLSSLNANYTPMQQVLGNTSAPGNNSRCGNASGPAFVSGFGNAGGPGTAGGFGIAGGPGIVTGFANTSGFGNPRGPGNASRLANTSGPGNGGFAKAGGSGNQAFGIASGFGIGGSAVRMQNTKPANNQVKMQITKPRMNFTNNSDKKTVRPPMNAQSFNQTPRFKGSDKSLNLPPDIRTSLKKVLNRDRNFKFVATANILESMMDGNPMIREIVETSCSKKLVKNQIFANIDEILKGEFDLNVPDIIKQFRTKYQSKDDMEYVCTVLRKAERLSKDEKIIGEVKQDTASKTTTSSLNIEEIKQNMMANKIIKSINNDAKKDGGKIIKSELWSNKPLNDVETTKGAEKIMKSAENILPEKEEAALNIEMEKINDCVKNAYNAIKSKIKPPKETNILTKIDSILKYSTMLIEETAKKRLMKSNTGLYVRLRFTKMPSQKVIAEFLRKYGINGKYQDILKGSTILNCNSLEQYDTLLALKEIYLGDCQVTVTPGKLYKNDHFKHFSDIQIGKKKNKEKKGKNASSDSEDSSEDEECDEMQYNEPTSDNEIDKLIVDIDQFDDSFIESLKDSDGAAVPAENDGKDTKSDDKNNSNTEETDKDNKEGKYEKKVQQDNSVSNPEDGENVQKEVSQDNSAKNDETNSEAQKGTDEGSELENESKVQLDDILILEENQENDAIKTQLIDDLDSSVEIISDRVIIEID